jgi:hypothetical protein
LSVAKAKERMKEICENNKNNEERRRTRSNLVSIKAAFFLSFGVRSLFVEQEREKEKEKRNLHVSLLPLDCA